VPNLTETKPIGLERLRDFKPIKVGVPEHSNPIVSVIIPVYNRSWSIERCVLSIINQTYRPIECIVVDDGSTDDTPQIVERLALDALKGIELRLIRKENGGANSARNKGLIECKGEYICFLDSDDWLLPESVKTRADILIADQNVDFCYGLCSVQDEKGYELRKLNSPWPEAEQARIAPYLFDTNSPLFRRTVCAKAGLWREDDIYGQEYEYFARIKYFSKKVFFIDKVLSVNLRHESENIFDLKNLNFVLAIFRILWTVKSLIMFSSRDNPQERKALANQFHGVAKQLYRLKDYFHSGLALKESLLLSWSVRCFLQRCFIGTLSILSTIGSKKYLSQKYFNLKGKIH